MPGKERPDPHLHGCAPPQTLSHHPAPSTYHHIAAIHEQDTQKMLLSWFKLLGLSPQLFLESLVYAFLPSCHKSLTYTARNYTRLLFTINFASPEQI